MNTYDDIIWILNSYIKMLSCIAIVSKKKKISHFLKTKFIKLIR